jgi:hypothetical protein
MSITNNALTTEATAIYTSTGSTATTVMYFHNADASARTFNLYVVPSGETLGTVHRIYGAKSVAAGDTYIIDLEKILMDDGDRLVANASANSAIVTTLSYVSV